MASIEDHKRLTPAETADYLRVSESALERWRRLGTGPAYRKLSRRCVRYVKTEVDTWLDQQRRTSTSDPGHEAGQ